MVHKITGKTAPSIVTWTRNSLPIPDAFIQRPHWPRMWAVPPVAKRSESLHAESQGCQRNEREERLANLLAGLKHLEFGFKGRNKNKGQTYQRQPIQHAAQLVVANTNVSVGRQGQQPPKRCQHFRRKSQHEELFRQRLVHDKIVLFGMLVHKPTPLVTYRFHGSRASLGKRGHRPCQVLEATFPVFRPGLRNRKGLIRSGLMARGQSFLCRFGQRNLYLRLFRCVCRFP